MRTDGVMDAVFARVPRSRIYDATGIQFLPFNTIYQLYAHVKEGIPRGAARLLMIPDLFHARLAETAKGEYTNATTTQLLDPHTGQAPMP
jgi:rhamnulokinase